MIQTGECAVCKSNADMQRTGGTWSGFYICPVCGRYELYDLNDFEYKAGNQLAPYLLYIVLEKRE